MVRGKKRCHREATEGSETCHFHSSGELARQRLIRDERRTRILAEQAAAAAAGGGGGGGGADTRAAPTMAELARRLDAAAAHVTPLTPGGVLADVAAGRTFEALCAQHKATWQQSKRAWHQPQVEALTLHAEAVLARADGGAGGATTDILELGAGKGLLSAVLAERHPECAVTVLDRREGGTGGRGEEAAGAGVEAATPGGDGGEEERHTGGGDNIRRIHADLQDCSLAAALERRPAVVIAKHFCGDATDLAVEKIVEAEQARAGSVAGCVLAPCCHPKTEYARYCGAAFAEEALGLSAADFEAMLVLIELGRSRSVKALGILVKSKAFARKIKGVQDLPAAEVFRYGRLARRVMEEGRVRRLRAAFPAHRVEVLEYVPSSVSPDNLIIRMSRRVGGGDEAAAATPAAAGVPYGNTGVVLHLVSGAGSDLPMRVCEYLLEVRGRREKVEEEEGVEGGAGEWRPMPLSAVWVADMRLERSVSDSAATEVVVLHAAAPASLPALLALVTADPFLERVVDKAFPFTHCVASGGGASAGAAAACAESTRAWAGEPAAVARRFYALPKALETEVVAAAGDAGLPMHPTQFGCVVSVVEWRTALDARAACLVSALPVGAWDPRRWPSAASAAVQPEPRAVARVREAAARRPEYAARFGGGGRVCVALSGGRADLRAAFDAFFQGAARAAPSYLYLDSLKKDTCVWRWEDPAAAEARFDVVVLQLDCVKEDALLALQRLPVVRGRVEEGAEGGADEAVSVLCSIKVVPPAKRNNAAALKQAHAVIAASLRNTLTCVQLLHLLVDKDNERTILGRLVAKNPSEEETLPK